MALNYEVKKRVFGFDETKTEKYVAQMKTLGVVGFKDLCDEVSKIGMAPRGVVKLVLDGLIDTLNMDINKGFSVQLGEFGCFRPGINAKSQDKLEDVTASTIYRRKIIFTPGFYFKEMCIRDRLITIHAAIRTTHPDARTQPCRNIQQHIHRHR